MLSVDLGCAMGFHMIERFAYVFIFHINAGVGCSFSGVYKLYTLRLTIDPFP
jgi:hypothetical protein